MYEIFLTSNKNKNDIIKYILNLSKIILKMLTLYANKLYIENGTIIEFSEIIHINSETKSYITTIFFFVYTTINQSVRLSYYNDFVKIPKIFKNLSM